MRTVFAQPRRVRRPDQSTGGAGRPGLECEDVSTCLQALEPNAPARKEVDQAERIWPPRGSAGPGPGAGRWSTPSAAAGTAVPCGLPPRHPPAGLPASGCRDGIRLARGRPPPGPYERLTRRASGAYDSLATVCVMHTGLLASDGCVSSAPAARLPRGARRGRE